MLLEKGIVRALFIIVFCFLFQVSEATQPNIVVIIVDDERFDDFAWSGGPAFLDLPAINRIANEGVNFTESFVVLSICAPSRATFMTGLYPQDHGIWFNQSNTFQPLPYTIGELIQPAGYTTGFIGKFHITRLPQPGWNKWLSFMGSGEYLNPFVNIDGQDTVLPGHLTDILTQHALDFIDNNHQNPFLLVLAHKAPKIPFTPQVEFSGHFDSNFIALPETFTEDSVCKPSWLKTIQSIGTDTSAFKDAKRKYYQMVVGIDASVQLIVDKLDSLNILDSTLVIYTSDNGLVYLEHGAVIAKRVGYEESIRVPLIARYPAWFSAGSSVGNKIVLNTDLVPTILHAAGVPDTFNLPGFSLKNLYDGVAERNQYYYHYRLDTADGSTIPGFQMIRNLQYKLVRYACNTLTYELYDIVNDPKEWNNLACNPGYDSLIAIMEFKMDSLAIVRNDTFIDPPSNCYIVPNCFEVLETVVPASSHDSSNGSILLAVSGGNPPYTFFWSTGDTTQGLQFIDPGQYMVSISDEGGCSKSFFYTVGPECSAPPVAFTTEVTIHSARLNWTKVAGVNHYALRGRVMGSNSWISLNNHTASDSTRKALGLNQQTIYEWQIIAYCDLAETITSGWSNIDTFITRCYAPDSIWTFPVTAQSARLNWSPVAGVVSYEIKGRLAGGFNWITLHTPQGIFKKDVFGLLPNHQYEWSIHTFCEENHNSFSAFLPSILFTTASSNRSALAGEAEELRIVPNPNNGIFTLLIPKAFKNQLLQIALLNMTGELMFQQSFADGDAVKIDTHDLPPGLYLLKVRGVVETVHLKVLIGD